jgi:hypothetical protein
MSVINILVYQTKYPLLAGIVEKQRRIWKDLPPTQETIQIITKVLIWLHFRISLRLYAGMESDSRSPFIDVIIMSQLILDLPSELQGKLTLTMSGIIIINSVQARKSSISNELVLFALIIQ